MIQKLWASSLSVIWDFLYHGLLVQPVEVSSTNSGDLFVSAMISLYTSMKSSRSINRRKAIEVISQKYDILSILKTRLSSGNILIEDYQVEYIKEMIQDVNGTTAIDTSEKCAVNHVDAADDSQLSLISSILPDYGMGFLSMCLEALDGDADMVIARILENSLPHQLLDIDRKLSLSESQKLQSRGIKGKESVYKSGQSRNSTKKQEELEKWCAEKSEKNSQSKVVDWRSSSLLDSSSQSDSIKKFVLQAQFEYEDEYDDSFDDLSYSMRTDPLDFEEQDGTTARSGKGLQDFYFVDGRIYNYKKDGSELIQAANIEKAHAIVKEREDLEKDKIFGLGYGGNKGRNGVNEESDGESTILQREKDIRSSNGSYVKRGKTYNANHHTRNSNAKSSHEHKNFRKDKRKLNVPGSKKSADV